MKIEKADINKIESLKTVIDSCINEIFPKYYNAEGVEFFLEHHSRKNIMRDIMDEKVYVLIDGFKIIGTGTINNNEICRLFIFPDYQGRGLGKMMMKYFEEIISKNYESVRLDASFPAMNFYDKLGYNFLNYHEHEYKNSILPYFDMQKNLNAYYEINYDGKKFKPSATSDNGEAGSDTIFYYHQKDKLLWGEYYGGEIIKGFLIGNVNSDGSLVFTYQHINASNQLRIGKCLSSPEILTSGKIRLNEKWQWLDSGEGGRSVLVEL